MPRQTQFRFPGRIEWRYSYALPSVGQVVTSAGESWRVASVEESEDVLVCSLEREESRNAGEGTPEELGA